MTQGHSTDYHDYVFRDGELLGEFELMYRHAKEIPWHQDKQLDLLDVHLTRALLDRLPPLSYLADVGCGLGFYLNHLARSLGNAPRHCEGFDVSPTAVASAATAFPRHRFTVLDVMAERPEAFAGLRRDPEEPRCYVMRATLWYVFPAIEQVVRNMQRMVGPGGHLLIVQNFPPLDRDFVGKDVIPGPEAITGFFSAAFVKLKTLWVEDGMGEHDAFYMGLFQAR